jgi:gamma-glutamylcyclotransferase (GGCT)/AIG2-like uncharacterized protein YtfP
MILVTSYEKLPLVVAVLYFFLRIQRNATMSKAEIWYFAYGSNLSKQRMQMRIGETSIARIGTLAGYQLAFRKFTDSNNTYATIIPNPGTVVHGVAYLCDEIAIQKLDRFEGVAEGCYRREMIDIMAETGESIRCYVYVGAATLDGDSRPSIEYLNWILTGAQEHGLPLDYIQWIKSIAFA